LTKEFSNESLLELYIFETSHNIEQLEKLILSCEKVNNLTTDVMNEIFRNMHTIKGSSAMMHLHNIASLAHAMEDLFYFIREQKPNQINCSTLFDLVLEGVDFIKVELSKIKNADSADGDAGNLIENCIEFLEDLKKTDKLDTFTSSSNSYNTQQYYHTKSSGALYINWKKYKVTIYFDDGCEMENLRAYNIVHNMKSIAEEFHYLPEDIIENDSSIPLIRENGFQIFLKSIKSYEEIYDFFQQTIFLKSLEVTELENSNVFEDDTELNNRQADQTTERTSLLPPQVEDNKEQGDNLITHQSIISVQVSKLDKLMDLVGEMVIAEAMVTQNPDLQNLVLNNFHKSAWQLRKITGELQDMVMSIRMVPLSATFQKMHRIVRDMSRILDKDVQLKFIGEETEVDKNVIEHISDPLMHLVRNSVDHGIEEKDVRIAHGKPQVGTITLEAKNAGSDVLITVKDDGKGLSKDKIRKKAIENGLIHSTDDALSDKEIYGLILLPGFSTKDRITEFSGRGVGMDVVSKNLEAVGGSITIDSTEGEGITTTLKIPLTLAIIDGMNIRVGTSRYTLPTNSILESFRPKKNDIIRDPDQNEMIMVRGQCYPILRLHELFEVATDVTAFTDGILIMVEQDEKRICLFADDLIGQQQVVVKTLPNYIKNTKRIDSLAGCTLLGDGSISLILNIGGLISARN
jgi:two-component system, chemotaxis family, sensor kinase CheA